MVRFGGGWYPRFKVQSMYFLEDSYYGFKKENDRVSKTCNSKMTVNRIPIRKKYTLILNKIQTPKHLSSLGLLPSWEVQGAGFTWDQLSLGWLWETLASKEETQINLLSGDCQAGRSLLAVGASPLAKVKTWPGRTKHGSG